MRFLLKTIPALLDRAQRRAFWGLFGAAFVTAILEVSSLGAVFALVMAILKTEEGAAPTGFIGRVLEAMPGDAAHATLWLGLAVIALYGLKTGLGVYLGWVRARASISQNAVFAERLLAQYLREPWPFFLKQHTNVLATRVNHHCYQLAVYLFQELAVVAAEALVILAVVVFLIILNPVVTLGLVGTLGLLSFVLIKLIKNRSYRWSSRKLAAEQEASTTAQTMLQGMREVLINHSGALFYNAYSRQIRAATHAHSVLLTWREVPRFLMEFTLVTSFLVLLGLLMAQGTPKEQVLSIAAVYGAASFRLLPSLSRLSQAAYHIRMAAPLLEEVESALRQRPPVPTATALPAPLTFQHTLRFENVSYRYPGAAEDTLHGISFAIERGQSIGVVGASGAGKTTLMELLLGLLQPTAGVITVDGVPLTAEMLPAWQAALGYVPQSIYLTPDSLARNIAFGLDDAAIDTAAVERAARDASMDAFIRTLPDSYQTPVGERGAALSGGQRQRLGIARALYRSPQVLLLDEATSALDTSTEAAVSESINALRGQKTLVLIAHRFSTVADCDKLLVLEQGRVVGFDGIAALKADNPAVRREFLGQ
ncbi:MAG: ABC transporter ATP-binding protein [Holosporales bacterium]